jgi:hypothetical protein
MPNIGWLGSQEALITLVALPVVGLVVRLLVHGPRILAEFFQESEAGEIALRVRVWNQARGAGLWQLLIGQRQDAEECRVRLRIVEDGDTEPVATIDERHSTAINRKLVQSLPVTLHKDSGSIFDVVRQSRASKQARSDGALYGETTFRGTSLIDNHVYCFHLEVVFRNGSGKFVANRIVEVGNSQQSTIWGVPCR